MPDVRTFVAISHESGVPVTTVRSYFDPRVDPRLSTVVAIERALARLNLDHLRRRRDA